MKKLFIVFSLISIFSIKATNPPTGDTRCSGKNSGDYVSNGMCDVIYCKNKREFTKEDGTTGIKCYCGDDGSDCNFQPGPSTGNIQCSGKNSGDYVSNGLCDVIYCKNKREFTKEDGTTGIKCYCGDDGSDCNLEQLFPQPSDSESTIPAGAQSASTPGIAETPAQTPGIVETPAQTPGIAEADEETKPSRDTDTEITPTAPKQRVKESKCFLNIGNQKVAVGKLTINQCNDNNIAKTQFTKGKCIITLKNPKEKLPAVKTDKKNCPMIPKKGMRKGNKYLRLGFSQRI